MFPLQLLERCKNVDVEDYDRVKKLVRDLQVVIGIIHSSLNQGLLSPWHLSGLEQLSLTYTFSSYT